MVNRYNSPKVRKAYQRFRSSESELDFFSFVMIAEFWLVLLGTALLFVSVWAGVAVLGLAGVLFIAALLFGG